MVLNELIKRSPVRIFEKSIHGGLKAGELGVIAAPSGIGKTSVLVQIALDKLLQGKKVIHVSFTQHTDYVLAWYEDIFEEFARKKNLENAEAVKNDTVKNRVLMKFPQSGVSTEQVFKSLGAMVKDGAFAADAVIIDGFDFSAAPADIAALSKKAASELGLSIWYSCTVSESNAYSKQKIPLTLKEEGSLFDVVIVLAVKGDHIELSVSKDREVYNPALMALRLDPKTLLIQE